MNRAEPRHRLRQFASDNNAGLTPEVVEALSAANAGHAPGYGDDSWTTRACDLIREWLQTDAAVFLVFNGTAANAVALAAACRPYHAVLCHEYSHIHRDECGAPEFFSGGAKLLPLPGEHARLDPEATRRAIDDHFPLHSSKPAAVSVSQATECGTVYAASAIAEIADVAHARGLKVHMDGARLANAVAHLGVAPADLTWRAGVDLLSLGLTKNGGFCAEAVVAFDRGLAEELDYRVKQAGQLASKMRFLAASWVGLLGTGAWLRHATHANAMAARLAAGLESIPCARLLHPRESNGVFVDLPVPVLEGLRKLGWRFYVFEGRTGCRLMCSWDTQPQDVDALLADLSTLAASGGGDARA